MNYDIATNVFKTIDEIKQQNYYRFDATTESKKDFTITKQADKENPQGEYEYYFKGEQIIFFITLTLDPNAQGALPNMDLIDTIPPEVRIISADVVRGTGDNPLISGQTITVTNVVLAASEENRIYQLRVTGEIR